MINARRLVVALGTLIAVGYAATMLNRGSKPSEVLGPTVGVLAPHDTSLAGEWVEVAALPAEELGRGPIVDLDEREDTLYLLQSDRWFSVVSRQVSPRRGSSTPGSPEWLAAGAAIRAVPGGVVILDRRRQAVVRWDRLGNRGAETSLRPAEGMAAIPEHIAVQWEGSMLASVRHVLPDGGGEWLVLRGRVGDPKLDTVFRGTKTAILGEAHNAPRITTLASGAFVLMPALEWSIVRMDSAGAIDSARIRADGPRWDVPDSVRQHYATLLERLPPVQRNLHALPPQFPPIRAVSADLKGRLLVVVAAGPVDTHVEVLSETGAPIGRLWALPETHSVFVANGSVFRVRETPDAVVVERQQLH